MRPLIEKSEVNQICDFGCGDGFYLKYFGSLSPKKNYFGIDISHSMIERAKQNAPFAKLKVSQKGIDFQNDFDLIYAIAVFAHIKDDIIPGILENIYQKLKPGGRFVMFEQTGYTRREGETWCRRQTKEYIGFASTAGFEIDTRHLISFPAHRFFENRIAPYYIRICMEGSNHHERCINANKSMLFKMISNVMVALTKKPISADSGSFDGNSFYVFKKI